MAGTSIVHINGTADGSVVQLGRPMRLLYINATGVVTASFDNGANGITVAPGEAREFKTVPITSLTLAGGGIYELVAFVEA